MFSTQNGTGVLFIPAYIDHGSTSGQSNGASRYVKSHGSGDNSSNEGQLRKVASWLPLGSLTLQLNLQSL